MCYRQAENKLCAFRTIVPSLPTNGTTLERKTEKRIYEVVTILFRFSFLSINQFLFRFSCYLLAILDLGNVLM